MPKKQNEAQQLAEALNKELPMVPGAKTGYRIAALLLRQDELLEQALEALSSASNVVVGEYGPEDALSKECENVIAAIRAHREAK